MDRSIYQFHSYSVFIRTLLEVQPRRGTRSKLAKHLGCQVSFLSQVLTDRAHLTLEHALGVAEFFNLSNDEREFFFLIIQRDRAGSHKLRQYFEQLIKNFLKQHEVVREKIEVSEHLTSDDMAKYYGYWWYSAIHILSALPDLNNVRAITERFALPVSVVEEAVEFLTSRKIIENVGGNLSIGKTRVHLDSKSPYIVRHHLNWRQKAMSFYEKSGVRGGNQLHYSAVLGLSRADATRIKNILLEALQKGEAILKKSKEEAPFVLLKDWFELA